MLCLAIGCLSGCYKPEIEEKESHLIRVGETVMNIHDFNKALEIHKTAYDYEDVTEDPKVIKEAKLQILKEMIERMTLLERARELGLRVEKKELDSAVREIQKGYPEEEFEKALLESAISLESWKKELADRLLMEKVIQRDLAEGIVISDDKIKTYMNVHKIKVEPPSETRRAEVNRSIRDHLRREKVEGAYQAWVDKLQKKYTIQINESDWKKIVES